MSDEIPVEDVEVLARSLHESCRQASKINMQDHIRWGDWDNVVESMRNHRRIQAAEMLKEYKFYKRQA